MRLARTIIWVGIVAATPAALGASRKAEEKPVYVVRVHGAPVVRSGRARAWLDRGTRVVAEKVRKQGIYVRMKIGKRRVRGVLDAAFVVPEAEARQLQAAASPTRGWPQFRGPDRTGVSYETGLLREWPKKGPSRLWTAKGCGVGYASVAVGDGLIATTGNVRDKSTVAAFDLDGNLKWQTPIGEPYWTGGRSFSYPGTRSTPTVVQGRVFVLSPHGDVACLDAATGKIVWRLNVVRKFGGRMPTWAYAESLLVDQGRVYCFPGGKRIAAVALDAKTGKALWTCREGGDDASYASAIVFQHGGLRHLVTMTAAAAIGLDADTGRLLWRHPYEGHRGINAATPIYHNGHVFITSGYGRGALLLKLHVRGKRCRVTEARRRGEFDNHIGGVVLVDGFLFGSDYSGKWTSIEFATGRVMYRVPGIPAGSVIYADGMLYCLTEDKGVVALVQASPARFKVTSYFPVPGANARVWAHPAICDGRLYVRYRDRLHAFDIRAGGDEKKKD